MTPTETTIKQAIDDAKKYGLNSLTIPLNIISINAVKQGVNHYTGSITYAKQLGIKLFFLINIVQYSERKTFPYDLNAQDRMIKDIGWILTFFPGLEGIEIEEPHMYHPDDTFEASDNMNQFFTKCKTIVDQHRDSNFDYGFNSASNSVSSSKLQGLDVVYINKHNLFTYFAAQAARNDLSQYINIHNSWKNILTNIELVTHVYVTYSTLTKPCTDGWNKPECWNQAVLEQIKWSLEKNIPFSIFTLERMEISSIYWPNDTTPGSNIGEKTKYLIDNINGTTPIEPQEDKYQITIQSIPRNATITID